MGAITAVLMCFVSSNPYHMLRLKTAGQPAYNVFSGTSERTTLFAAITLLLPIVTPGKTTTPAPSHTLWPILIGA